MSVSIILWAMILSYMLIGLVSALLNDYVVKKRKLFVEKLKELRMKAFNKGKSITIEIKESSEKAGIDADDVIKDTFKRTNNKLVQFLPIKFVNFIIFATLTICGPLFFFVVLEDYNKVKMLRKAYHQAQEITDQF